VGRDDATKARVLDLVLRLGISPHDELFVIMIALNHLQLLIEDAPQDWQTLFSDFQGELEEWSKINLDTLDAIIRKAEQEQILAQTSQQLASALKDSTMYWNKLNTMLSKSPLLSQGSKLISLAQEQSDRLQTIQSTQKQHTEKLTTLNAMTMRSSVNRIFLPLWLKILLVVLTISTLWDHMTLSGIQTVLRHGK
jgi:hypothetical protein